MIGIHDLRNYGPHLSILLSIYSLKPSQFTYLPIYLPKLVSSYLDSTFSLIKLVHRRPYVHASRLTRHLRAAALRTLTTLPSYVRADHPSPPIQSTSDCPFRQM